MVVLTGEAGVGKTVWWPSWPSSNNKRCAYRHRCRHCVGGETPFAVWLEMTRALVGTVRPVPGVGLAER